MITADSLPLRHAILTHKVFLAFLIFSIQMRMQGYRLPLGLGMTLPFSPRLDPSTAQRILANDGWPGPDHPQG
jgi:hypothetical protein